MNEVVPERPKLYGDVTDEEVVSKLLPAVAIWASTKTSDLEGMKALKNELLDVFSSSYRADDGYQLARKLDRDHRWDVDSELVEILNDAWIVRDRAWKILVKEWVVKHNILPQLSVGQPVAIKGNKHQGEVLQVIDDEASYLVHCSSLGHVKEGNGIRGIYVPYEQVEVLSPVEPTPSE